MFRNRPFVIHRSPFTGVNLRNEFAHLAQFSFLKRATIDIRTQSPNPCRDERAPFWKAEGDHILANMSEWWRIEGWPTADEWQAFWSSASAVIAAILLWIAWRQLGGLAISNRSLAESNELLAESNRALSRPTIVVRFEFERVAMRNYNNQTNANNVFITVENVGASPAVNVILQVTPAFKATTEKLTPEGLAALNALFAGESPIRMIAPHQRLKYILDSAKDALGDPSLPPEYTVKASYTDIEGGGNYTEDFVLQMSPWGMSVAEVDPAKQLSRDVQFISENLKSSWSGLPKIASAVRNLRPTNERRRLRPQRIRPRRKRPQ